MLKELVVKKKKKVKKKHARVGRVKCRVCWANWVVEGGTRVRVFSQ